MPVRSAAVALVALLLVRGASSELAGNAALLSACELSRTERWKAGGKLARRSISGGRQGGRPAGSVTASPDVQADPDIEHEHEENEHEEYAGKRWNLESLEGGSDKSMKWRKEKGGGTGTWVASMSFIAMIGSMPAVLAAGSHKLTKVQVIESLVLYAWLLGGLYAFTHVVIFQSPHFEEPRTLSVEECAYLFAQILTTVGYGDITPARPRGQLFVGLFVLLAVLLIAAMIQEMIEFFEYVVEKAFSIMYVAEADEPAEGSEKRALTKAFEPVIFTSLVFCAFIVFGTFFFTQYPGEGKTFPQAVYMSLITLSTVGFGAYLPSTHAGMVVSAYWMLFGTASVVAMVTSRAAFSSALKRHETEAGW